MQEQRTLPTVLEEQRTTGSASQRPPLLAEAAILDAAREVLRANIDRAYLDPFAPAVSRRQAVIAVLRPAVAMARQSNAPLGRVAQDADTLYALYAATLGWGPAQRYLDDPHVNEVKIVGTAIRVQEAGHPFVTAPEAFPNVGEVVARVKLLADVLGIPLDAKHSQQTLPLQHGTRLHATIPPTTVDDDSLVCIRRGRAHPWTLDDLLERGSMDAPTAALLRFLIAAHCSFLVIGSTGSGKTTLLEALANSWGNRPHVITIEDNTLELVIRQDIAWTRELVHTHLDPQAFGRVAREALRQTPDLIVPGETRANEAGAILSLIMSNHPVMTSIHARSGADGLERFARCAAMPGAYMYADRRDDALDDAANGFEVAVVVERLPATGRRVITEISLVLGVDLDVAGRTSARTFPLVEFTVAPDGQGVWQAAAAVQDDGLHWQGNTIPTLPPRIVARFSRVRQHRDLRVAPTVAVVATALAEAERHLQAAQPRRALETLRPAWAAREDVRLLEAAVRALSLLPLIHHAAHDVASTAGAVITAAVAQRRWHAAAQHLAALRATLEHAAAWTPAEGWVVLADRIQAGQAAATAARIALPAAQDALQDNSVTGARHALHLLDGLNNDLLDAATRHLAQHLRVDALTLLVAHGAADAEALRAAQERLRMLEQQPAAGVVVVAAPQAYTSLVPVPFAADAEILTSDGGDSIIQKTTLELSPAASSVPFVADSPAHVEMAEVSSQPSSPLLLTEDSGGISQEMVVIAAAPRFALPPHRRPRITRWRRYAHAASATQAPGSPASPVRPKNATGWQPDQLLTAPSPFVGLPTTVASSDLVVPITERPLMAIMEE